MKNVRKTITSRVLQRTKTRVSNYNMNKTTGLTYQHVYAISCVGMAIIQMPDPPAPAAVA